MMNLTHLVSVSMSIYVNKLIICRHLIDFVSYEANVNKMLELARNFGTSHSLRTMWRVTFEGRRHELLHSKITKIDHLLKTRCPMLDQEEYVSSPLHSNVHIALITVNWFLSSFVKKWI